MNNDVRELIDRIPAAIKATEYKYFGDYEMSDGQRDAVEVLVQAALALTAALEREEALRVALEPFAQLSRRKANYVIRPNDPAVLEAVHALES